MTITRRRQLSIVRRQSARLKTEGCGLPTDAGVVLIAVLWIFAGLAIIALSFSKESYVEVAAARNAQSLESSYFAARAGIMATIYQIKQKKLLASTIQQPDAQENPDAIDLGKVKGAFGGIVYEVDIQEESGKLNVTQIQKQQLVALMEAIGIGSQDADIISDSIKDWCDGDAASQPNGAENDYYEALNPPYQAKNGPIDVVEELLLVRGMTSDYFFGHPERTTAGSIIYKYGLSKYLTRTRYSYRNQINVNSAPLPVLLSINGMPPETAQLIYDRRRTKPFKNQNELMSEFSASNTTSWLPFLYVPMPTDQSGAYSLTASAHPENSKVRRIVRAVITIDASETGYRTLYWNENVPDYEGATQ